MELEQEYLFNVPTVCKLYPAKASEELMYEPGQKACYRPERPLDSVFYDNRSESTTNS